MYLTYIDCSVFMNIRGVCLYVWWGGGGRPDCNAVHSVMRLPALPLASEDLSILCFLNEAWQKILCIFLNLTTHDR